MTYLNPRHSSVPDTDTLMQMCQDILQANDNPLYIKQAISRLADPFLREAIADTFRCLWNDMRSHGDSRTFVLDFDTYIDLWPEMESDMYCLVKQSRRQQNALLNTAEAAPVAIISSPDYQSFMTQPTCAAIMPALAIPKICLFIWLERVGSVCFHAIGIFTHFAVEICRIDFFVVSLH